MSLSSSPAENFAGHARKRTLAQRGELACSRGSWGTACRAHVASLAVAVVVWSMHALIDSELCCPEAAANNNGGAW
jgi:hypothetical protein